MDTPHVDVEQVAELLRETGRAHHEAFADVDGADPEWPLWYAERLAPELSALLGTEVTRSELVHALMLAEEAHGSGRGWAEPYAQLILERQDRAT